jgi:hypothetical protein
MQSLSEDPSALYHRVVRYAFGWLLVYTLIAAFPGTLAFVAVGGNSDYLSASLALVVPLLGFTLNVKSLRTILRRQAYPRKYWEEAGACLRSLIRVTLIAAAIALALTLLSIRWESALFIALIPEIIILLITLIGPLDLYHTLHDVFVTPYFESAVGGVRITCIGKQIARHLEELDDLARLHDVTPLAEFGWNDDLKGEVNVWRDAPSGMKTVNVLLSYFQGDEFAGGGQPGVVDELKVLAQSLSQAADRGIRFCLLLFCGGGTNEMKEARRKGFHH